MRGKCPNCRTEQELAKDPPRVVLHALPRLASPVEIEVPHRCTNCGREVGGSFQFAATNKKSFCPQYGRPACCAEATRPRAGAQRHDDYLSELSRRLESWTECAVPGPRGQAQRRSCHRSLRRSRPHGGVLRAVLEAVLGDRSERAIAHRDASAPYTSHRQADETQVCSVLDSGRGRPVRRTLVRAIRGRACLDQPTRLDRGSSATK